MASADVRGSGRATEALRSGKSGEFKTIDTSVEVEASRLAARRRSSREERSAFAKTVVSSAQSTAQGVIAEITARKKR